MFFGHTELNVLFFARDVSWRENICVIRDLNILRSLFSRASFSPEIFCPGGRKNLLPEEKEHAGSLLHKGGRRNVVVFSGRRAHLFGSVREGAIKKAFSGE